MRKIEEKKVKTQKFKQSWSSETLKLVEANMEKISRAYLRSRGLGRDLFFHSNSIDSPCIWAIEKPGADWERSRALLSDSQVPNSSIPRVAALPASLGLGKNKKKKFFYFFKQRVPQQGYLYGVLRGVRQGTY